MTNDFTLQCISGLSHSLSHCVKSVQQDVDSLDKQFLSTDLTKISHIFKIVHWSVVNEIPICALFALKIFGYLIS